MNGIKITYGNQTKRISEEVTHYDYLLDLVMKLFLFDLEQRSMIEISYLDIDNERIEVSSDKDFQLVCNLHKNTQNTASLKLEVFFRFKDSLNFDDINPTDSIVVIDMEDVNNLLRTEEKKQIEENPSLFGITNLSKSIHVTSVNVMNSKNQEEEKKYSQFNNKESKTTETFKIETLEEGVNTKINEEKGTQNESQIDKETETFKIETLEEGVNTKTNEEKGTQNESQINKETETLKIETLEEGVNTKINEEKGTQNEFIIVQDSKSTETLKIETLEEGVNTKINEEKGTQNEFILIQDSKSTETFKVATFDEGINAQIEVEENSTQIEQKLTKEASSSTEKLNIKEESSQAENKYNEENIKDVLHSAIKNNPLPNTSNEEILVSKFEEILSFKIKEMEDNFKKYLDSQSQQSKMFQNEFNSNLQKVNYENINLESDPKQKIENQENQSVERIEINLDKEIQKSEESFYSAIDIEKSGISYFKEVCSECKFQIVKNKYICILCEDFILCSQCQTSHIQHPLLKINIECQGLISKEEIIKFLTDSKKEKKVGLINGLMQIGKMFRPSPYYVTLYSGNEPTIFAMPQRSKKNIELQVHNQCNKKIDEELIVMGVNTKSFSVSSKTIEKLDVNEIKNIVLSFEAPKECGVYEFEVAALMKIEKLINESIKFQVRVVKPDEVDNANADILFENFEELINLPKDKKVPIYNLIKNGVVKLDIEKIIGILRKHDYDIDDEAFNELVPVEEAHNQIGECYYGQQY